MKIETKFTHDKVRFDKTNDIHLVVSLKAPKLDWEAKRPPVCIIPIIDVSTSMGGDKLDYAKKTLIKLIDHLRPGDFCGLGAFSTGIYPIQAPIEMTQTSKDALKVKVGELAVVSSTHFSGGLELGLKWGSTVDIGNMLVRVIMLTDGQANHGISDAQGLAKIVDTRGKTTVSCFGYGTDANQELLADLAKRGEGNYAFIKDPDEALSAFGKELGGLLSTYAQNIVLDLAPHNGHKIEEVVSDVDVEEKDSKVVIKLGDLLSEEERHVVIAMKLSEQSQALPREMNIVDIKIDYDLIIDGKREHRQEEQKAKIRFVKAGEEQDKPTKEVDQIVGMAQVGKIQIEAEDHAKKGDFKGAVAKMQLADDVARRARTREAPCLRWRSPVAPREFAGVRQQPGLPPQLEGLRDARHERVEDGQHPGGRRSRTWGSTRSSRCATRRSRARRRHSRTGRSRSGTIWHRSRGRSTSPPRQMRESQPRPKRRRPRRRRASARASRSAGSLAARAALVVRAAAQDPPDRRQAGVPWPIGGSHRLLSTFS